MSWRVASRATSYCVQVSMDPTFATMLLNDSSLADTSKAVGSLAYATKYYWRVNAKNAGGTSAYTPTRRFTTVIAPPTAPTLALPADSATGVSLSGTLVWNVVSGADSYRVQLSTNAAFSTTLIDDSTVTVNSKPFGPLAANTRHYWRVNAKNAVGMSAWSNSRTFVTVTGASLLPTTYALSTLALDGRGYFRFALPVAGRVTLTLFDLEGRVIARPVDGIYQAGYHTVSLVRPASAVYFVDFRAGSFRKTVKIHP
jgi:hypothetical protein